MPTCPSDQQLEELVDEQLIGARKPGSWLMWKNARGAKSDSTT